jgi:hypothetical protein
VLVVLLKKKKKEEEEEDEASRDMVNSEFSDGDPKPSVSSDHSPSSEYRNPGFGSEPLPGKKLPSASSDVSSRSSRGSTDIDDLEGVRSVLRKRRLSRQSAVINYITPPETHSGIKVLLCSYVGWRLEFLHADLPLYIVYLIRNEPIKMLHSASLSWLFRYNDEINYN